MIVPTFKDDCSVCGCPMGHFPIDCRCICHEKLILLQRFSDKTMEQIVKEAKQQQKFIRDNPDYYIELVIKQALGIMDDIEKDIRDKVNRK